MSESTPAQSNSPRKRPIKKSVVRRSRGVTWLLVGVTLFVLMVFAGASGLAYLLVTKSGSVDVEQGSYLSLTLAGPITDAPVAGGLFQEPEDFPMTATDIASIIRQAATDERVAGLYLDMKNPSLGWGLAREIRTALVEFREAEKPCVAYSELYMTKGYYIASACDKVLMAPAGVAYVAGIESTVTYYRDALENIGIEPQFVHVGNYKTAIEPFERTGPSEAAIEANEALLESLYVRITSEIAQSRNMSEQEVRQAIDDLNMTPEGVIESGLLDGVAYPDVLKKTFDANQDVGWIQTLKDLPDSNEEDDNPTFISGKKYRQNIVLEADDGEGTVAIVFAEGVILSGGGEEGLFGSSGLFDGRYRKWMRDARDDDEVKAVVVRVNSPGGSALASDFMWREVALTKALGKPVVISMGDYAASGGYMMSCNADWIIAQPTTITGSIGVFGQFFSLAGTYEKIGLSEYTFKRGQRADLLTQMDVFDAKEKEILQAWVEDTYEDFVGQVATGRGRTVEEIEPVAQGRVWTGDQAITDSHHLVDQLGGLHDAVSKAAELAGLASYSQRKIPEQRGFIEVLFENFLETKVDVQISLPVDLPVANEIIREIEVLQNIEKSGRVGAYLPGWN